jgi:HTH-type transcriptional regulator, competence development regulator
MTTTLVAEPLSEESILGETTTTTGRELGLRLRQVRELRRQPLSAVANHAEISTAYLQKLESGSVKQPSPNILYNVAKALDMDYAELMRLAGYVVPNDEESSGERRRNELTHALSSEELSEEEAAELARYLDWYRSSRRK